MKRRWWVAGFAAMVILSPACGDGTSGPIALPPTLGLGEPVPLPEDPQRQFDFWLGEWDVVNKRARDGRWIDDGTARARIHSVVDGGAVLEEWEGTLGGKPLIGFSLRAYDAALGRWVIWLNWTGTGPDGFSEMHGRRNGERMETFPPGDDQHLRFSFAEARTESCQWEQATSSDGQTWFTDWVMHFTRREEPLALDAANAPISGPPDSAAEFPQTRELDFLLGAWEGSATAIAADGSSAEGAVRVRVTPALHGLGLLLFLDTGWGEKNLMALGWDRGADGWVALLTDNRGGGITRMVGTLEPRGGRFIAPGSARRESWSCPADDACSWRRETSSDGGANWVTTVEARLTRSVSTAAWIDFPGARAPFERVLTGGQPTADQLAWAARNGYRTVVNLRAPGEEGELPGEAELVESLGMKYFAIPLAGADELTTENASKLALALEDPAALPAIVHCASGNRVGALFGLKARAIDGLSVEEALEVAQRAGIARLAPALRERLDLVEQGSR